VAVVIDVRKLINNAMLHVEVVEEQHTSFVKHDGTNKYDDPFVDFSGGYIFVMRNPGKFKDTSNTRETSILVQ
jgi:hypothetical protein